MQNVACKKTNPWLALVLILGVAFFIKFYLVEPYYDSGPSVFQVGGIYASIRNEGPGYNVLKLLKIDDGGYHIKVYSNIFPDMPVEIDETALVIVGLLDKQPNTDPGISHVPIAKQNFESWKLTFIQHGQVVEDDLEGYYVWKETQKNYF